MWWIFVPPIVGLVAAVGAGIAKRQKTAQAAATGQAAGQAAGQGSASTQGAGTQPGMPATPPPGAPTMTLAEVTGAVMTAAASGNPQIMRDMAAKIRAAGYPDQASQLEQVATAVETVQHQQTQGQGQPPTPAQPQIVDGSTWSLTSWNASTGYSYLTDPTGNAWPVPAGSVRNNGSNIATSQDYTLSDTRIVRNPVKSPTFYTAGGIPVTPPPVTPVQPPPVQPPPVQPPPVTPPPVTPPPYTPPVTPPPTQTMTMAQAATIFATATASGDPAQMRAAAVQLRAGGYAQQATLLEQAALVAEQMHKPPPVIPVPPPIVPTPPIVPKPPIVPTPPVVPPVGGNRPMADAAVSAVLHQPKGSPAQLAAVKQFQVAEKLGKQDGQYGTESAKALADRYTIVPPQPLYWGPVKGTYAQYLADKKDYQTFLQKKATTNPPGTQWTVAASAIKLSGDEIGDEFQGDASPGKDKNLASQVYLALRFARKKTDSEPRALVQRFQNQEGLQRRDGSYNSETALALADRYGLVPAAPFYWGKENGSKEFAQKDKNQYAAHLLVLRDRDPQRADEWEHAAKV
jgi:hypothetical protein